MCDFEPPRYIELIQDIRQALGPDVLIRVDPHASWSESQALRFMKAAEPYGLEWIEERWAALSRTSSGPDIDCDRLRQIERTLDKRKSR